MISGILLLLFIILSAITDVRYKKINIQTSIIFFLAGMVLNLSGLNISLQDGIFGMSIGFLLIGLSFASGEKIGLGDGIIFTVTGVYLGFFGNFLLLSLSLFLCACFSAGALIFRKADRNSRIPMVPFLIIPAICELTMMAGVL